MTVFYICLAVLSVPVFCGLMLEMKDRDAARQEK